MAEVNQNLWAPWRMEYIHSLHDDAGPGGCFLCQYVASPEADAANHVIWRGAHCMTLFNRFPYSNGHLLVAPLEHCCELGQLSEPALLEMMCQLRDAQRLLRDAACAQGFNIGFNFGRCAGAGLPDHLHAHIVPRWEGDTNFMPVLGDCRVIPQSIDALREKMRHVALKLGLPEVR